MQTPFTQTSGAEPHLLERQAFKVIHWHSLQEKLDTCVLLKTLLHDSLPLWMPACDVHTVKVRNYCHFLDLEMEMHRS